MDENKQTSTTNINVNDASVQVDGGAIDFDQLLITQTKPEQLTTNSEQLTTNGEQLTTNSEQETTSSISTVNALMQDEPIVPKMDIGNIQIEEVTTEKQKAKAIILGESGIGQAVLGKLAGFNYRKMISISTVVIVVSILVSLIAYGWNRYLDVSSQPKINLNYQGYLNSIKDYQKILSEYTNIDDYYKLASTSLISNDATGNVDMILNSNRLGYVQKKDILQNGLNGLASDIVSNIQKLDSIKQDVTQYGFFPKDLLTIFGSEQEDISIKNSLMALEVVKFTTAIKVFSYLDTFIKGLANLMGTSTEYIQDGMQTLDQRGEKDVKIYLNTCYLNPFEVDSDCNLVADFDRYYQYFDKNSNFDKNFFKKLMGYIDIKLENSDMPSFNIVFQKFDPTAKEISFNVEVNTFKDDETSLIRQGIVNPHIFVVTQLLNLLKQSLFVIGENINDKQFSVVPKVIQIGSTIITANSSSMVFNLPIQKNPQREIADFILNSNYFDQLDTGNIVPSYELTVPSTEYQVPSTEYQVPSTGDIVEVGTVETGIVESGTLETGIIDDQTGVIVNQPSIIGIIE